MRGSNAGEDGYRTAPVVSSETAVADPAAVRSPPPRRHLEAAASLTPAQLAAFRLEVAPLMPVFICGPPGIGKSALARGFAAAVGLPCVSLLGSQLAPEAIIGVP